ncbi:MAG: MFS transporter [Candidatus Tectimicrobiota bacterium]|nr:MAG: MFS transporter [Candidatus Tectomicrobia bacterium]
MKSAPTAHDIQVGEARRPYGLLAGLSVAHLVNDFYTMLLPPLLPPLLAAFGLSYFQGGLLSLCYYLLSGVLQPTVGHLADRYALRKRLMMAGFAIFAVGFLAIGLAPTYPVLLLACLLCGLGAATFHPQSTYFLTRAFPEAKGWAMGIHGWGGSIGNFLAPLTVAALVSLYGWRQGVMLAAVPAVLVIGLLAWLLREPQEVNPTRFGKGFTRELLLVALTFALISMVLRAFLTFLPTFLVERGSSLTQAGFFTSLMLCVGLVAQPLGGQVYDRVGGKAMFLVASLATGLALWLFTLSAGLLLVVWAVVIGFFVFALFPVSLAMGSELARDNGVGVSVGIIFGLSFTLSAFTPAVTGFVADRLGLNLAFQLLVFLAALAALLSLWLPARRASAARHAGRLGLARECEEEPRMPDPEFIRCEVENFIATVTMDRPPVNARQPPVSRRTNVRL